MGLPQFESLQVTESPDGRVVRLVFDHGKANEIGTEQLVELERLVAHLHAGPAVALISSSAKRSSRGTPIFVSGANVLERAGWSDERVIAHVAWQRTVLASLRAAPVFHVCVAHGVALGWGTEFLLTADWRIAVDGATFGLPETRLGILPGAGGTSELWAQLGVAWTLRLGMTGARIEVDDALRAGLVQERVASPADGQARADALAADAAMASPTAMAAFKQAVLASVGTAPNHRVAFEVAAYQHCVQSGQAAVGRAHFAQIIAGTPAPWGPRQPVSFAPNEEP